MSEIQKLTKKINKWVSERGRQRYQKPKDLAISLCLEAAEVLEHFQWKNNKQSTTHIRQNKEEVADELADVAIYLFKLAHETKINLAEAIEKKLTKSAQKYPVEKSKGKATKWTKL